MGKANLFKRHLGRCVLVYRGDFIATKKAEEIKGMNVDSRLNKSIEFNDFIDLMNLVDVPSVGK